MIERHLIRMRARHDVTDVEERVIRGLFTNTRRIPARGTVVAEHTRLEASTLILDGLACRYRHLRDGSRHAVELTVPGDFADLHGFTLKSLDHSIQAVSDTTVAIAPHERIREMTEAHPRLTRLYWFSTNLDASIHREWEVSLAGRDGIGRAAALFLELQARLRLVGLAGDGGYALEMTQNDLAECLGLTPVHVNRVLRQMREDGLLRFKDGRVDILDPIRLRRTADWTEDYLYLRPDEL